MCKNIKTLFNFDPPVTSEEIRAASLQFVRKISGFNKPSKANEGALLAAVDEIAGISTRLLRALETNAPPKSREEEAAKAKARAAERFGPWGSQTLPLGEIVVDEGIMIIGYIDLSPLSHERAAKKLRVMVGV
jgi:hypothetical protein